MELIAPSDIVDLVNITISFKGNKKLQLSQHYTHFIPL
jgi:hypothetical protein